MVSEQVPENAVTIVEKADLPALNDREALWLSHYFECRFNASAAARLAFGYTNMHTAQDAGYGLKHRPHVQAHIKAQIAEQATNANRILMNVARIANAEWGDTAQVKLRNGEVVDVRLDLDTILDANELLGKEVGLFREKLDVSVEVVPKRYIDVDDDKL